MDNGWDADLLRPDRAGVSPEANAIVTDPATGAAAQSPSRPGPRSEDRPPGDNFT
jgi:hypothetical protein